MRPRLNSGNYVGYLNDAAIWDFVSKNKARLNGLVLDIGCGDMRYRPLVAAAGGTYTGLDLAPGMFGYSVKADIYWDGARMDIPDNSYDAALLMEVLEHCPDPLAPLSEAQRVLKPGGALLVSVPFLYALHGTPYDYRRLTPSGLEKLVRDAGFSSIVMEASGAWDASLGQAMALWLRHRPMPVLIRKILRKLFVPLFRLLLRVDAKHRTLQEGALMPGILGIAVK